MTTASSIPARPTRLPAAVLLSLAAVYVIWGSTYFAIRVAVAAWPPLLMVGTRFIAAGTILFAIMLWRGAALPTPRQWLNAAIIGLLLLGGGNGFVTIAEQWVSSSLAAAIVATAPLWVALLSGLLGQWPSRAEWLGIAIGFTGVVLLNLEGEMRANPLGALALIAAPLCWSVGSVLSRRLSLPDGPMGTAAEMLTSGVVLTLIGWLSGEHLAALTAPAVGAWLYLVVFGSLVAFSAYMYLIRTVRPALALSYTYVNPVIAVALGAALGGESLTGVGLAGIGVILVGVICILLARSAAARPAPAQAGGQPEPVPESGD
ncbi:MAG: drug/metabolite exporter YedA [Anaerolineales bacterium]|nr:drug/metabolite exporter YedA [Anaerolineales bacterium]